MQHDEVVTRLAAGAGGGGDYWRLALSLRQMRTVKDTVRVRVGGLSAAEIQRVLHRGSIRFSVQPQTTILHIVLIQY